MVYCAYCRVHHRGKTGGATEKGGEGVLRGVSHKGSHSVAESNNAVTDSRDGRTLHCSV